MKKSALIGLFILLLMIGIASQIGITPVAGQEGSPTQSPTPTPAAEPLFLNVFVDSAFIRVGPSLDAEPAASTFEGQRLEAIGRNADGTWFEVSRPYRAQSIGWISREVVAWTFSVTALPLTDSVTGVTGPTPIIDTGISVFILTEVVLRDQPIRNANRVSVIPSSVTVPVIGRNQDASWLFVNYLGTTGWISGFTARTVNDLMLVPLASNIPPPAIEVVIIPPEVQRAQIQRLRDWATYHRDFAINLSFFWEEILNDQVMPCEPPPFITEYQYSFQDNIELPELRRYVPRANEAIEYINASLAVLVPCGVFEREAVSDARADAINARIILDNTLDQLDNLEELIPD